MQYEIYTVSKKIYLLWEIHYFTTADKLSITVYRILLKLSVVFVLKILLSINIKYKRYGSTNYNSNYKIQK